jgi:hypothetical protein
MTFEEEDPNDTRRPILAGGKAEPFVKALGRDDGGNWFGMEEEGSFEVVYPKDERRSSVSVENEAMLD